MAKTAAFLLTLIAALANTPATAQVVRAFVSAHGSDANPCSATQPCRTFQHAHDTVPANGMIWVLDPAGYQPVTITKGITIQANGMGEITQTASPGAAITISVATSDPVTLNGLVIDGLGTGQIGINITSGASVQILNSVVRHFSDVGIIDFSSTSGSNLLIEDTIVSDNQTGISVFPQNIGGKATLNRITANNNFTGVGTANSDVTIANSVLSNNSEGLHNNTSKVYLAKNVISGNATGVFVGQGTTNSYQDNYIQDNGMPLANGGLTPAGLL
jgi:hypothetical protein